MITLKRSDLNKMYNLNKGTWDRRHDDLMNHLNEYMNITERGENTRFYYDVDVDSIDEMPKNIPPLPRKNDIMKKIIDYTDFTTASLGTEFKPNSISKIARDAIFEFGQVKYNHQSMESVAKSFIRPAINQKGERSATKLWVFYDNYEPLDDEAKKRWYEILKEIKLTEKDMAHAFIKEQQGEDITKECNSYKKAMEIFKKEFGSFPVHVYKYKLKVDAVV